MDQVKKLIDAGATIPTAIKESLALSGVATVQAFANKYELDRATVAGHINGGSRATDETIGALSRELGGSEDEWRELLWLAAKPASTTV